MKSNLPENFRDGFLKNFREGLKGKGSAVLKLDDMYDCSLVTDVVSTRQELASVFAENTGQGLRKLKCNDPLGRFFGVKRQLKVLDAGANPRKSTPTRGHLRLVTDNG